MLANLTTPLIGIVSATAVARLGDSALLGGIGIASVLFDCLFWLFGFLRSSAVAFTAQSLGARKFEELPAYFARGLVLAFGIGAALIALQTPIANVTLEAIGGGSHATAAARDYFFIRIWSSPLVLGNYVVLGWLIGQSRAKLALLVQLVINLINIGATILLVLGLGSGVAGAAFAAGIAESVGLLLGILIARHLMHGCVAISPTVLFDRPALTQMLMVNRDMMIRTAAMITALLFFTATSARLGDITLAANSVLNNLLWVTGFLLDGLASAAAQVCGQAFGARDRVGFSAATRLIVFCAFFFGILGMASFAVFGSSLIDIMSAGEDVCRMARKHLVFVIALQPLVAFALGFEGIYIGATWAREVRNLMLVSLAIFLLASFALRSSGNAGLWMALLVFYAARAGLDALRYQTLVKASFGDG
ncbi:MATE family efflux transporter [Bradyrhizobium sp. 144]|uniref:MATE family efflux transporter n=1 Tax=Bradyrhizobium sp. 144 TaxID=2782620 RepID=UPI001FF777FD|nr:MATE family efflux transporter [Bradyrhizobium sp. 144]MCK1694251.1 MATE family efflux transporter [Bradyrhizobium sp. 144]